MFAEIVTKTLIIALVCAGAGYGMMRFQRYAEGEAGWRDWLYFTCIALAGALAEQLVR